MCRYRKSYPGDFQEVSRSNLSKLNVDIITAYGTAVTVYGNGQRSGVITNLAIAEFNMREEGEQPSLVVIPCVHHKTSSQGLAQLVISEDMLTYVLS